MLYNGQILHVKHFCITESGPKTFEAIQPPWRPILQMATVGLNGTKPQKAQFYILMLRQHAQKASNLLIFGQFW